MPEETKQYRLDDIVFAVPRRYADATSYEFAVPDKGNESSERLLVAAGNEPARANSFEVVSEIMGRAKGFDPPLRELRSEPTKVDSRDAYAWDYSLGEENEYVCRRVVIDLGKRRYLSVVYTTRHGPADQVERWKKIVERLRLAPASTAGKSAPAGFRRRRLPEVEIDVPSGLERRDLCLFRSSTGATITLGITLFSRPGWAGVVTDDADRPETAGRVRDRKSEPLPVADGQLQIDRYELAGEQNRATPQLVVRAKRIFPKFCLVIVEGRAESGDQSIDGDTLAVALSVRPGGQ